MYIIYWYPILDVEFMAQRISLAESRWCQRPISSGVPLAKHIGLAASRWYQSSGVPLVINGGSIAQHVAVLLEPRRALICAVAGHGAYSVFATYSAALQLLHWEFVGVG